MSQSESSAETEVRAAIEGLYRVFARYNFHPDMPHCEHCIEDEEVRQLGSKPLRELMPEDLSRYAAKALTTWGGEDDYRHFLPRMFEIVSFEGFSWPHAEVVLGRLNDARWHAWPLDEQEAVTAYLGALWHWHLSEFEESDYFSRGDILCAIGRVENDLMPYLVAWEDNESHAATRRIAHQVIMSEESLADGQLWNAFWSGRREQEEQAAMWLRRPGVVHRLERARLTAPNTRIDHDFMHARNILMHLIARA